MRLIIKILKYLILGTISYLLIDHFSVKYSFSDYKDYNDVLINISSMVFTIMGIWIAFLYPNALSRIVNTKIETADFSQTKQETKRLEALVASVLKSAAVTVFIMAVYLGKVILFSTPFYLVHFLTIKNFVLSLTIVFSYIQLEAVGYVIYSNIMFLNDLHHKREEREADADI